MMTDATTLTDAYGRRIRKLRVSLLDACNFRCSYCMPEHAAFQARSFRLKREEIFKIASVLVGMGMQEIRLTGGEPTLRPDLIAIAQDLSELPLKKLGMTSNGFLLSRILEPLKNTACQYLNISLDSLNPELFRRIARFDGFDATMGAIFKAQNDGFKVKINTVLMRGVNDHEIQDFVAFSANYGIEIRFLELMAIGEAAPIQEQRFISAEEILHTIERATELRPVPREKDATARVFESRLGARIGVIAPVTQSFCGDCSRWRLTADGDLRACLMAKDGINLRGLSTVEIQAAALKVLGMKPRFGASMMSEPMHAIGG